MSLFQTMTCPECGTRMHLRRTRVRRTMEGYDTRTVWWDCDCGRAVTEGGIDPTYRGIPLPRKRAVPYDAPRHGNRLPTTAVEVPIPADEDGLHLVKVVVRRGDVGLA